MSPALNSPLLGDLIARLQQIRRETVGLTDVEARALASMMEKEARLIAGLATGPIPDATPGISLNTIIGIVSAEWSVAPEDITGRARRGDVCLARCAAYGLLKMARPNISSASAAAAMGAGDHGSAIKAWKRCRDLLETDRDFARRYRRAAAALSADLQPPTAP